MDSLGLFSINPEAKVHIQRVGGEMRKNKLSWMSFLIAIGAFSAICASAQSSQQPNANSNTSAKIARGQYIVNGVAMCGMCHTPRNDANQIDRGRWLDGAALWLLPAHPQQDWPLKAPRIAGTPPGSDEDMVRLLTTGLWKDTGYLRSPMPQFRMSREDAEAVVSYLRSLTPHAGD